MRKSFKENREIWNVAIAIIVVLIFLITIKSYLLKNSEYQKNLLISIGFGITIVSWFIIAYINNESEKKKDRLNTEQSVSQAKRDLRIKFLLDAYFRLENSDYRDLNIPNIQPLIYEYIYAKYAESALTSIQLLGNPTTIKLANDYILSNGLKHFDELLLALRNELRDELELPPLPKTDTFKPTTFRTHRKADAPNVLTPDQQYNLIIKLSELTKDLIK